MNFDFFSVLQLLGGVALFLFGMSVMGEALEKSAGKQLKTLLGNLTSNPLKGFALGAVVTAIIQSSSATTVMLVGFVNSGIMTLSGAIPIIMGANVGTTITAWILSLTGLEGDNLIIKMLKPSSFTPILAVIGVVLFCFLPGCKVCAFALSRHRVVPVALPRRRAAFPFTNGHDDASIHHVPNVPEATLLDTPGRGQYLVNLSNRHSGDRRGLADWRA